MSNSEMKIAYTKAPQAIKMSDDRLANLFLIDVLIGTHKIPFVFDTGASMTFISESVAQIAGAVSLENSITFGGNANDRGSASTSLIDTIHIGEAKIQNIQVGVLPDGYLNFGQDEDGNEMIVNGFLGWDIIQHFKWTLNCANRAFIFEKPIESGNKENLFWDNMPIIFAKYKGQSMHFGFDTGNTESIFSQSFIPFIETKREKTDKITGVDGVVEEDVFVADHVEFTIGKKTIELNDIPVFKRDIFPTKKYNVKGLLAADIIQNSKCIIDYINHSFEIV